MARFAPVAPIQILEEMSSETFGSYHLFLAHHTVEQPERFRELLLRHTSPYGRRPFNLDIIMDNSIVELGGAVDSKMIKEAVNTCSMDYCSVVPCLPDVMGDGQETLKLSAAAYNEWVAMGMHGNGLRKGELREFMVVTQGSTWAEFTQLVDHFFVHNKDKYFLIRWVGIPRYMLKQWASSRHDAIQYIKMVAPHVKIHLLGFSQDIFDDMRCAQLPSVIGIDSAVPVRYEDVLTPGTTEEAIGKRGDWWEKGHLTTWGVKNIHQVRQWANK